MSVNVVPQYQFENIPQEIQSWSQWVVWKYIVREVGKKPSKVPFNARGHYQARVTNPSDWSTFAQVVEAYRNGGYDGIGYCFSDYDPFNFIDMDAVKNNKELLERHEKILQYFRTYQEYSPSGEGYHIICKGDNLDKGIRSSEKAIELYTSERFATFTGWMVPGSVPEITEQQELLDILRAEIVKEPATLRQYEGEGAVTFVDKERTKSNEDVLYAGMNNQNSAKFGALMNGNWRTMREFQHANGTADQSRADQSLMNYLHFLSGNKQQMIEIFMQSDLGQRSKVKRPDYLHNLIENSADFTARKYNVVPELVIPGVEAALAFNPAQHLADKQRAEAATLATAPAQAPLDLKGSKGPAQVTHNHVGTLASTPDWLLAPPPGVLGEVANFILSHSNRPVKQMAVAAAIAFMAGICGRSFNINGTGINMYVLLLAGTGRGKEGMRTGISKLIECLSETNLNASRILGPDVISSGQAIHPQLAQNPCFLAIMSEFQQMYTNMVASNASTASSALKQQLLNLFMLNRKGSILGKTAYSDSKKDIDPVRSPALSILAECTISGLNKVLDISQIEDGLLPRFLGIVYDGERLDGVNVPPNHRPSAALLDKLSALYSRCERDNKIGAVVDLEMDAEAFALLDAFDKFATRKINDKENDDYADLWSRAHIKALRLAGLLCASDFCVTNSNLVNAEQARWAISVVQYDVENIIGRFKRFEIGDQENDAALLRDTKRFIAQFYKMDDKQRKAYSINDKMKMHGVISYRFLSQRCQRVKSFGKQETKSLDRALQILEDSGVIFNIKKEPDYAGKYGTTQRAYRIVDPAALGEWL